MCLFCDIANKKIPTDILKENENFVAFRDINPKASTHILIIPKKHSTNFQNTDCEVFAKIGTFIQEFANENALKENYKLQINNGEKAGQEIMHLHYHLLSNQSI